MRARRSCAWWGNIRRALKYGLRCRLTANHCPCGRCGRNRGCRSKGILNTLNCTTAIGITCSWANRLTKLGNDCRLGIKVINHCWSNKCGIGNLAQRNDKRWIICRRWQSQCGGTRDASCSHRFDLQVTEGFISEIGCGISQFYA